MESNKNFAIDNFVSFDQKNGIPTVILNNVYNQKLEVSTYGAHILSWIINSDELLFLSSKSEFLVGKAIRGGVPLVFPQFGIGPLDSGEIGSFLLPPHGFARITEWHIVDSYVNSNNEVGVELELAYNDSTLKLWPAKFIAKIAIKLGKNKISQILSVKNIGDASFKFNNAFHTYYKFKNTQNVEIHGLADKDYLDSTKNREKHHDLSQYINFDGEIDRIYIKSSAPIDIIEDNTTKFRLSYSNCHDVVVWNAGKERCAKIADLKESDYLNYVCVEPGNVSEQIMVNVNDTQECGQEIEYLVP
jgi:glucose-6-phosphate 1-epimerase